MMKRYKILIEEWLNERTLREQYLLLITGVVVVYVLFNSLFVGAVVQKHANLSDAIKNLEEDGQKNIISQSRHHAKLSPEMVASLQKELTTLEGLLVDGQKIPELISTLVGAEVDVEINALNNVTQEVNLKNLARKNQHDIFIYQNKMDLSVAGEENNVKKYIERLELLPVNLMITGLTWQKNSIGETKAYITIEFYSDNKNELRIK